MRIALRLGVLPLCCALYASGCAPVNYETLGPLPPAVKPKAVQVLVFRPPECAFEVVGNLSLKVDQTFDLRLYSERRERRRATRLVEFYMGEIRRQAGKRGADVVWFQSDTIKLMEKYCDCSDSDSSTPIYRDCYVRFLEGVLGRCRE
jgi:hypothetical protein